MSRSMTDPKALVAEYDRFDWAAEPHYAKNAKLRDLAGRMRDALANAVMLTDADRRVLQPYAGEAAFPREMLPQSDTFRLLVTLAVRAGLQP